MRYENLSVEVEEGIALLRLNRPRVLNAINRAMLAELEEALDGLASPGAALAIVVTGEGKAFAVGADIGEMRGMGAAEARAFSAFGSRVIGKLESIELPVIAAVNGFALGGGCELALACDIRIASEAARFGLPEASLGMTPGFSGTRRLPRAVGVAKAKELIFTGEPVDAAEALRIGLVSRVVGPEELLPASLGLARRMARNSPLALAYAKAAMADGLGSALAEALERELFALCFAAGDPEEGMGAFMAGRSPSFPARGKPL
jgi:enoyl-CoA hydratase